MIPYSKRLKGDKTRVVFFSCIHHFYLCIYVAVPVSRFVVHFTTLLCNEYIF